MIIHISRDRFERIIAQGWKVGIMFSTPAFGIGDNEYHFLYSDHDHCDYCGQQFDSIPAETLADLEVIKLALGVEHVMLTPLTTSDLKELIEQNRRA